MRAFKQFRTYPVQSVLIVVAVALGVAVVTAVAATLQQTDTQYEDSLYVRTITLVPKKNDNGAFYRGGEQLPVREIGLLNEESVQLTLEDLAAAREAAPSVDYAYVTSWTSFQYGDDYAFLEAMSVTEDYLRAADVELLKGSYPSSQDFAQRRQVILLSENDIKPLELSGEPVGQVIDFQGASYTVVGIVKSEQANSFSNTFVPYGSAEWEGDIRELNFVVDDKTEVAQARAELQAFAQKTWGDRVSAGSADDFNDESFQIVILVIAAFASTALAAASLNTMNLMLARVLKRRHAIGIERSLGATKAMILRQFLSESLLLGALGGTLGSAAGYGLYLVYTRYQILAYGKDAAAFIGAFPWSALIIGLIVALLTSLLFGLYPAWQASRLRPVEALREV